jgi:hypothetical protein
MSLLQSVTTHRIDFGDRWCGMRRGGGKSGIRVTKEISGYRAMQTRGAAVHEGSFRDIAGW